MNSDSEISRWDAFAMLLMFGEFIFYIFKQMKTTLPEEISYMPKSNTAIL